MVKKNPEEADYFEMKFRFLQSLKMDLVKISEN